MTTSTTSQELHVIFGTGPLGTGTARELLRHGKRVRLVNRRGQAALAPQGAEVVKGDAYDVQSVRELTRGAAAVYQCAQPAYHEWAEKFPPLQAAILAGTAANGAKFIVGDNLYLYGDPNGATITEASPINPTTKKGRVRAAMAQAVMDAHQAGKVRAAIGRASNFLGPEYDILGDLIFYPALTGGTLNFIGSMDAPHSFTYIPDYGRGLATLGLHDSALGQAWIVPCLSPITQRDIVQRIGAEIGQPPKFRAASRLMLRALGLFNPSMRETVEMLYEFEKPYIVSSAKFEQAFGMTAVTVDEAIRTSVAWYRQHPRATSPHA